MTSLYMLPRSRYSEDAATKIGRAALLSLYYLCGGKAIRAEQFRQRRALQKYARNAAGNLVRAAAFRECDYTEAGLLREFSTDDDVLAFEAERYSDGSGYRVKFSSKPKAPSPATATQQPRTAPGPRPQAEL